MDKTSFSLVNNGTGTPKVTTYKNSFILSYPCSSYSECTEYQTTLNAGKYKLEVWGAEGGTRSLTVSGGKGGYSSGVLTLSSPTLIFISIGSKGGFSTTNNLFSSPTFGGGGFSSPSYSNNPHYLSSNGGGGTDIRIGTNDLQSRVIVAGGGGGTGIYGGSIFSGGFGGGTSGEKGVDNGSNCKGGIAGSQNTGGASVGSSGSQAGSFGNGGSTCAKEYWGCGGGGGWFGGSNGYDGSAGGGGGSGFVLTRDSFIPSGYKFDYTSNFILTNPILWNGNTSFLNPFGNEETGHIGNGIAKITLLSSTIVQKSRCCPCFPGFFFLEPIFVSLSFIFFLFSK